MDVYEIVQKSEEFITPDEYDDDDMARKEELENIAAHFSRYGILC